MGYIRAEEILPTEVIELIQQYVDGANIYIPKKYKEYLVGLKTQELAEKYFLSEKSIQRILRKMKNLS